MAIHKSTIPFLDEKDGKMFGDWAKDQEWYATNPDCPPQFLEREKQLERKRKEEAERKKQEEERRKESDDNWPLWWMPLWFLWWWWFFWFILFH